MDRNAYMNEEFGLKDSKSFSDHQQQPMSNTNRPPFQHLPDEDPYHPHHNYMQKNLNQERELYQNYQQTPSDLQHPGAPNFAPINPNPSNIGGADFFGDEAEQDEDSQEMEEKDYRGNYGADEEQEEEIPQEEEEEYSEENPEEDHGRSTPERYADNYEKETNITRTTNGGNGRL